MSKTHPTITADEFPPQATEDKITPRAGETYPCPLDGTENPFVEMHDRNLKYKFLDVDLSS